jgi:hypothetical protein
LQATADAIAQDRRNAWAQVEELKADLQRVKANEAESMVQRSEAEMNRRLCEQAV